MKKGRHIIMHGSGITVMSEKEYQEYLKSPVGKFNKIMPVTDKMKNISNDHFTQII